MEKERYNINLISELMGNLGIELTPGNEDTPRRVAKMYAEMFSNINGANYSNLLESMTLFDNNGSDSPITIKNIKFHSMCEHHWLPFFGLCDITYIPRNSILGLSKFPRAVKYFCKKPQIQEGLTREIGEFLVGVLNPKMLKVTLHDVTHTCVLVRGAEAECTTDTIYEYKEGK